GRLGDAEAPAVAGQLVDVFQHFARAPGHARFRLVGHDDRHARLEPDELGQPFQQGAAAGEHHAVLHDVAGELRRRFLQHGANEVDDGLDRLLQRLVHLGGRQPDGFGQAREGVAPAHFHGQRFVGRKRAPDLDLYLFRRALADEQLVLAAHVADDGLVELVAADAQAVGDNLVAQRNDRNIRRAPANVHDQMAARLRYVDTRPDGRGHGLGDEDDLLGARFLARLDDGPLLDAGDARRHAHGDLGTENGPAAADFADEMFQHELGHGVVGDNAVFQRPNRDDAVGGTPDHAPGLFAHRQQPVGFLRHGDDRRLAENDALPAHENEHVGR